VGGFKVFLTKSNALALAIGVIIGVALGSVVMTLVNAIIMPPIGWVLGSVDFASIKTVLGTNAKGEEVSIGWGLFLNSLIVFVVVMLVVYVISKIFIKEAPPGRPIGRGDAPDRDPRRAAQATDLTPARDQGVGTAG
jgi:large conductance mechanosensitive channel